MLTYVVYERYQRIIDQLGEYGRVLTAFVGDKNITVMGSEHEGGDKGIHDRDVAMLEESEGELSVLLYYSKAETI